MSKRRRRRRHQVRVTPLGYAVLGVLVLIVVIGVYFVAWSLANGSGSNAKAQATDPPASVGQSPDPAAATPTLPPIDTPTPTPTATPEPTPTPEPTTEPTTTPGMQNDVKLPTKEQIKTAVDGKLKASGVVLRKGPDTGYDIIGKYVSGTNLKIYAISGEYYFCQIMAEQKYGYMAVKFVERYGLLPGEEPTPSPEAASGVVSGTVTATKVALRKVPSTEGYTPLGDYPRDTAVWIYFQTDGFYYVEVPATGAKGYMTTQFVMAQSKVPEGTPVP